MEAQKTSNCQSHPKNKERSWRYHSARLQIILQSNSNPNGMVLTAKQSCWPMKQNWESRSKPMFIWANNFLQRSQNIQWRKKSLFNKWCWENWKATCKRMKRDCCLSPHTRINSEWIKDLNIWPETINCIEENIEMKLKGLGLKENFMNLPWKAKECNSKINE